MKKFQKLKFLTSFENAVKVICLDSKSNWLNEVILNNESNDKLSNIQITNNEVTSEKIDIQTARIHLADCVTKGRLNADVLLGLQTSSGFLPIEGSLLDYKRDVPTTSYEFGKLVKHICAFHNMYGGYLIFGVDEVKKDKILVPVYKELQKNIDSKKYVTYVENIQEQQSKSKLLILTYNIKMRNG